ncbi:protein kinase [Ramlibacter sp. G-1-2-2]|uniref:Protein kinase n=1 Tax=Ramlibacter agri TaxID=2728837 RepID=A0A848GZG8_9BURK|nr:protein kinase [Ramlibacter agri]
MNTQPPIPSPLPREYVQHLARQGFDLIEVLGHGLSGSVYAADQRSLHRKVAVKFFDSAFVRDDAAMQKRFVREAKLLARFQHPNIPYVLTEGVLVAEHGQTPYMVMEYVHGHTLQKVLQEKKTLELRAAVDVAVQVLDALGYAHASQIVHRDVKPSNIMIDARDRCFLIDFSIGVSFSPTQKGVTRATTKGEMLGSPPYASPEQLLDAASVDARSDLFGVGVMLVEMLTGSRDLTNLARTLSTFPRELVAAIEKACATDPNGRHSGADDFIRAIGRKHHSLPRTLAPALALCTNTKCPDANWTSRGFYRGPRVIRDSTSSYCTSCGKSLTYLCRNCGSSVGETPYCGGCGAEVFNIPECKTCGSWLTRDYMDSMGAAGCLKCKDKPRPPRLTPSPSSGFDDMDDDIPF